MQAGGPSVVEPVVPRAERRPAQAASALRAGSPLERLPALAAFMAMLVTIEAMRVWASSASDDDVVALLRSQGRWLAIELATMGAGAVAGPLLAERFRWQGWRHLALTVALTVVAVGAGAGVIHGGFEADLARAAGEVGATTPNALVLRGWWFFTVAGILFGAFASSHESGRAAVRGARLAELECVEVQRAVLELRLQVLHARLDPPLVFASLDEIADLYRRDARAADELLDGLIAYLRAALPRLHGVRSTLGEELDLLEAYLRVLPETRTRGLAAAVRVPATMTSWPFPPAVLLPLVRDAALSGAKSMAVAGRYIEAEGVRSAEVTIEVTGVTLVPGWTAHGFDVQRRALEVFYGGAVSLEHLDRLDGVVAVLRFPVPVARDNGDAPHVR